MRCESFPLGLVLERRRVDHPWQDHDVVPFLVTACPYEAESYIESGDEIVEGVPMPDVVLAWVEDFVEAHHVEEPFKKRKRKPYDPRKGGFDQGRGGGHG